MFPFLGRPSPFRSRHLAMGHCFQLELVAHSEHLGSSSHLAHRTVAEEHLPSTGWGQPISICSPRMLSTYTLEWTFAGIQLSAAHPPAEAPPSSSNTRTSSTRSWDRRNKAGEAPPDPGSGILPADTQGILTVLWSYLQPRAGEHYPHDKDWKAGALPDSASTFAQCCPSPLFTQLPLMFSLTLPRPPS